MFVAFVGGVVFFC